MKISIYNKEGKEASEVNISEDIFGLDWNPDLVHQVFVAQRSNAREYAGHAKDRSEVSGGGRKPWRQKGTGRARHGSIRSPIWVGGGVTFGPNKTRSFKKNINKKMKIKALFSLLSKKLEEDEIIIIEDFQLEEYKTKSTKNFLNNVLGDKKFNALLVATDENKGIKRGIRNIKGIDAISAKSLNVSDILSYKNIIIEKGAIEDIANHYSFEGERVEAN